MDREVRPLVNGIRPPLKWAGGKRWQVPHLLPLWEPHARRRLVEPFCGGLAVTLGLQPGRALLNDANQHLVNFYRWLQRGLRSDLRMENDESLFYLHRARFNDLLRRGQAESAEAASLFYYLNRTGYNGLCRFNGRGEFNVPFGRYTRINYVQDFSDYRQVFEHWVFTHTDVEAVPLDPGGLRLRRPTVRRAIHRSTRREGFPGTISSVRLNGWPGIAVPSCSSIRPPAASKRSTGDSATRCSFSTRRAGSAVPATARPLARSWGRAICERGAPASRGSDQGT